MPGILCQHLNNTVREAIWRTEIDEAARDEKCSRSVCANVHSGGRTLSADASDQQHDQTFFSDIGSTQLHSAQLHNNAPVRPRVSAAGPLVALAHGSCRNKTHPAEFQPHLATPSRG